MGARCIECDTRIDEAVEPAEWFVDGAMCQACFKQCSDALCSFENQRRIANGASSPRDRSGTP